MTVSPFQNGCECSLTGGGFCKRHNMQKTAKQVQLCNTHPKYFNAWERERLRAARLIPMGQHSLVHTTPPAGQSKAKRPKPKPRKGKGRAKPAQPVYLGDRIGNALKTVGVTDERVSAWLGRPCGCPERRRRLNQLDAWIRRLAKTTVDEAKRHLEELLAE